MHGLDVGPTLTLTGPNDNLVLPETVVSGRPTDYALTIGPGYFSPGTYTLNGPGGTNAGPLTATLTIPPEPQWASLATLSSVARADGLTIAWSGGGAQSVLIVGTGFTDAAQTAGASFYCRVAEDAGTFTVPPSVLLAPPATDATPNGTITFQTGPPSINFTANGLTIASTDFDRSLTQPVTFKWAGQTRAAGVNLTR